MQTVIDNSLYVDSELLSGLEAMSEMRELLDELYGEALPEISNEGQSHQEEVGGRVLP